MVPEINSIQVDGVSYDAQALATFHPGGPLFIHAFAGRDATTAFLSYHRREFPHTKMTDMKATTTTTTTTTISSSNKEYLELCAIVEKVLPRSKSFAPLSYFLKAFVLLSITFGLEFYIHKNGMYTWYLTAMLGWLYALIGLNIQHDANHGAISRNPLVNRVFGMSQNWIGGSAVDWIHQHVVQHHTETNHVDKDPDIVGNALLRFNPKNTLYDIHGFQHVYLFFLLPLFGFTYVLDSFKHNLERFHFTKYSNMLERYRTQELASIVFFGARWIVLPIYMTKTSLASTFLNIAPLFVVGGYYLSFFFIISHNFEGVVQHHFSHQHHPNFLRNQVSSSSNVGGPFLCFINGGLNYQIEHHLFPRVSHVHYPTIAPVVREYCLARGIPYVHFPTVWENVYSCSRHLYVMGNTDKMN